MAAIWNSHESIALAMIGAKATPDIQDKVRYNIDNSNNYCYDYRN